MNQINKIILKLLKKKSNKHSEILNKLYHSFKVVVSNNNKKYIIKVTPKIINYFLKINNHNSYNHNNYNNHNNSNNNGNPSNIHYNFNVKNLNKIFNIINNNLKYSIVKHLLFNNFLWMYLRLIGLILLIWMYSIGRSSSK